ncbi:hypothetical protein HDU88_003995 [Geranomyces variabilis]|nr:hypothetical protein HDU88_003995 [Geranomyces variabilis]
MDAIKTTYKKIRDKRRPAVITVPPQVEAIATVGARVQYFWDNKTTTGKVVKVNNEAVQKGPQDTDQLYLIDNDEVGRYDCALHAADADGSCIKYTVIANVYCDTIAARNGLTSAEFYSVNPNVAQGCTNIWVGQVLCVSRGTNSAAPVTTEVIPSGNADGTCKTYVWGNTASDGCDTIASRNGMTTAQFISLNPAINSGCTNAYPGEVVSISAGTLPQPKISAGNADGSCKTYVWGNTAGDGCDTIASRNGMTTAQFISVNPQINAGCTNARPSWRVCVSAGKMPPPTIPPGNSDGTCKYRDLIDGDSCEGVAARGPITIEQLLYANPYLMPACEQFRINLRLCLSAGTKPSRAVSASANGTCYYVTAPAGASCDTLAMSYDLTAAQLDQYNNKTVGYKACPNLQAGVRTCVSSGTPPPPIIDPELATMLHGVTRMLKHVTRRTFLTMFLRALRTWQSATANCPAVRPGNLITSAYNYLIFSFASMSQDFMLKEAAEYDLILMRELTAPKREQPGLKVAIAVGGWAFNDDPETCTLFSRMVSTAVNRARLGVSAPSMRFKPLYLALTMCYRYRGASDRCGSAADTQNLNLFLQEAKASFATAPEKFLLTIAMPAGYWYLQNFDVKAISAAVDRIHLMTYDFHGQWDANILPWLGPKVNPHTSNSEIETSLMTFGKAAGAAVFLKIALGVGFYGCGFTPSRTAAPGRCTNNGGTLAWYEIREIMKRDSIVPTYVNGSAYMTHGGNQWVGFDDFVSLKTKLTLADKYGLAGVMVW